MNLGITQFSQPDIQNQMHYSYAPDSSHAKQNEANRFISIQEISAKSNLSEEFWYQQAKSKQVIAVFDPSEKVWMFSPRAYECFLQRQEQQFFASNYESSTSCIEKAVKPLSKNVPRTDAITHTDIKTSETHQVKNNISFNKVKQKKEKTNKYFKLNKSERSVVASTGKILLKQAMSQDVTPDYITMLDLKLVSRKESGTYQLDLRGNREPIPLIKKILNCKSSRYSLGTKIKEEASCIANQAIHDACIINKTTLLPLNIENKTLYSALAMSYTVNASKGADTVDEMQQKLGFWNYIAGDVPLDCINRYFILSILDQMRECGIKGSTRHSYGVELRKALEEAKENGLITSIPKIPSFTSGRRGLIELPWDVWIAFINSYALNRLENMFLKLLWHIGQRHTNVLELNIRQINIENRLCHIPATKHKSGEMIDIPLSEAAVDLIEEILSYKSEKGISSELLFEDITGRLPKIDKDRWDIAIEENNLDPSLTIHHVRHYFATDLRRHGASKETVANAGGWRSTESLNRYDHTGVTQNEKDAVNNRTGLHENKSTVAGKSITINNGGGVVNIN